MMTMMMMPTGFRFNPTDEELIDILERKVSGQEMPLHDRLIVERNVYELDPQDLQWDHSLVLPNNERYCYYMRENDSREVSGRGWWRATGHVKKIYDHNNYVFGYKRPLTFIRFTDVERKRKNALKTNWIMHEYSLDSNTTEWRLCKIKYKGKQSVEEEPKEQKQPQSLMLDNNACESYSKLSNPMGMKVDFCGEQEQQLQALQLEVFEQNMQMEVMDGQVQPQQNASYDPILTHIAGANNYFGYQLEQANAQEELFFSFWSWET